MTSTAPSLPSPETGRLLGVDYGERRVGLAVSDPTATIAQPLPALSRRRGKRPPVAAIMALAHTHNVRGFVIGLPLSLDGDDTEWTREVRAFADAVGRRSGLPVHLVDERFTSARAERAVRALGLKRRDLHDKKRIDAAAAVLILQSYLDRARSGREN